MIITVSPVAGEAGFAYLLGKMVDNYVVVTTSSGAVEGIITGVEWGEERGVEGEVLLIGAKSYYPGSSNARVLVSGIDTVVYL